MLSLFRRITVACLALAGSGVVMSCTAPPPPPAVADADVARVKQASIDLALKQKLTTQRIPRLDFVDIELKDVVSFLREVTVLNFAVRWNALSVAGIDKSTAVNVNLTDVTIAQALDVILEDLGAAGTPLMYVVKDSRITISTREDLERETEVRLYDVRCLLRPERDMPYTSQVDPPVRYAPLPRRGGSGSGFFEEDDDPAFEPQPKFVQVITDTVDPTSWRVAGGEVGMLRLVKGHLVIDQTIWNHEAIQELLGRMKAAMAQRPQVIVRAQWYNVPPAAWAKLAARGPVPRPLSAAQLLATGATLNRSGATTGYDGQLVHFASGREESFIPTIERLVAEGIYFRPVLRMLLWGVVFEVRPTLLADSGQVRLDLKAIINRRGQPSKRPITILHGPPTTRPAKETDLATLPLVASLDKLDLFTSSLRISVRVPLDQPVLVGAMPVAEAQTDSVLCLVVEVSKSK